MFFCLQKDFHSKGTHFLSYKYINFIQTYSFFYIYKNHSLGWSSPYNQLRQHKDICIGLRSCVRREFKHRHTWETSLHHTGSRPCIFRSTPAFRRQTSPTERTEARGREIKVPVKYWSNENGGRTSLIVVNAKHSSKCWPLWRTFCGVTVHWHAFSQCEIQHVDTESWWALYIQQFCLLLKLM